MQTADQLDDATLQSLHNQLNGSILTPGSEEYDELRTGWNDLFDKRPAAIARCKSADDVVAAVNFAREHDVALSVKSTGHSYAGKSICDGGLVVDLSQMNEVELDSDAKTARVGPGVTWHAFDEKAQENGLATTGCTVSTVGVSGYTLGGGTGHLARKHGLSLDNLLSAEVVTAGGEVVRASENEHPDLFWALRGGSSNFGVVTAFEFQLHEVGPEIIAGQIVHPIKDAPEVLRFYRALMADAPDELTCYAFIINVPPIPAFPEDYHGKPAISLVISYVGPVAEGDEAIEPLRNFGDPILSAVEPMPYTAAQQMFDEGMAKGNRWYSQAHYFDEISDDAIDTVVSYTEALPGSFTAVYFEPLGGTIGRVEPEATAFPHRGAAYSLHIFPGWSDAEQDDELIRWAQEFHDAMAPYANGGVYVNLLSQDEAERVPNAYGNNYDRLVDLKKKWDPQNLFRMNHNIEPTG